MPSSSYIDTSHYLYVQRNAPEYSTEPSANIQFADETELDTWYANWIKRRTHINKRNATAISHVSEEVLKACLLPKESRYFICDHSRTKTVKKEATNVSVSEGLPSGEASESYEVATKRKRVTKKTFH
jgi:hypothetical protein